MNNHLSLGKSLVFLDTALEDEERAAMERVLTGEEKNGILYVQNRDIDHDKMLERNHSFAKEIMEACPDFVQTSGTRDAYIDNAINNLSLSEGEARQKFQRSAALEWIAEDKSFAAYIAIEDDNLILYLSLERILTGEQIDEALAAFRKIFEAVTDATHFPAYDTVAKTWLKHTDELEEFFNSAEKAAEEVMRVRLKYEARVKSHYSYFHFFNVSVMFGVVLLACLSAYFADMVSEVLVNEPVRFQVESMGAIVEGRLTPEYQLTGLVVETGQQHTISVAKELYDDTVLQDTLSLYETHKDHKPLMTVDEYTGHLPIFDLGVAKVNKLFFLALLLLCFPLAFYWLYSKKTSEARTHFVVQTVRLYMVAVVAALLGAIISWIRMM